MDIYYSNLHKKIQANKPSRFEHIAAVILKIIILASVTAMFFINSNFIFGTLFAIFTYKYSFYGLFIKQPAESKPYPYVGGSAWNASKSASIQIEKQKRRSKNISTSYRFGNPANSTVQVSSFNNEESDFSITGISYTNIGTSINPANGLPMVGVVDVDGNPYGVDNSDLDAFTPFDNDHFNGDSFGIDDHSN
ncbi:hypothetical protein [Paraglaciecola sp. MB-3u-78]|uniref:hypothetical protein n=1 Tax=Paraglaciecola sp. MB-3u-78 TaxID=2058332 RepID=UPI000C32FAB8|nr:hypothetical protein [Paraglaciecola sp. MB-3u-78]PKH00888.1 hypothetical protein CXF95_01350 [Paraglaciecola sp. MB-3u-78]